MANGTRARNGEPMRFLEQAVLDRSGRCIIWPYTKNSRGYGQIRVNGEMAIVARVVLEKTAGPAPDPKMVAAHAPLICHNPSCCQPQHLRWATLSENSNDMKIDGTQFRPAGERHHRSRLTAEQVAAIRLDPRIQREIAADYGVRRQQIGRIKQGVRWAHLL